MKYAAKSGRIPTAAAFLGTKLNLKPVMKIADCSITTAAKCRGERKLVEKVAEMSVADMEPAAIYQIGAAVAANSGPRVVGVSFTRKVDE